MTQPPQEPGWNPYQQGQSPYGPPPYGQAPQGQQPYGQVPQGPSPEGQQPYGQQAYSQVYGQQPNAQAPQQGPSGQPQYGAQQSSDPSQLYQPPGAPYAYVLPPANPQANTTNGFAIAGLIFGLIPMCFGFLGIVFGAIGLSQANSRGQKGRGLAIAGIICGTLWLVGLTAFGGISEALDDDTATKPTPTTLPNIPSFTMPSIPSFFSKLNVGDCLTSLEGTSTSANGDFTVTDFPVVSCSTAHRAEVFYNITLTGSTAPSSNEAEAKAQECATQLSVYAPSASSDPSIELAYLYPTAAMWATSDRTLSCVATFTTARTSSIKGT